jgi:hypothetical protein
MLKKLATKIRTFTPKCTHILKNALRYAKISQKNFIKKMKMLKKITTKISTFTPKYIHILKNINTQKHK